MSLNVDEMNTRALRHLASFGCKGVSDENSELAQSKHTPVRVCVFVPWLPLGWASS
jgi:hypothetical protein